MFVWGTAYHEVKRLRNIHSSLAFGGHYFLSLVDISSYIFPLVSYLHFLTKPKAFRLPLMYSVQQKNLTVFKIMIWYEIMICSIELILKFFSRSFSMTEGASTPRKNYYFKLINTLKKSQSGIILIFTSLCPQINLFLTFENLISDS